MADKENRIITHAQDSLTTAHIERGLTTAHLQQRLEQATSTPSAAPSGQSSAPPANNAGDKQSS
jgi:hypothetical protein